jgi:hypothetical protein
LGLARPVRNTTPLLVQPVGLIQVVQTNSLELKSEVRERQVTEMTKKPVMEAMTFGRKAG